MRIIRIIFILVLLACAPGIGHCAGAATTPVQTETSAPGAEPEEHGLSPNALEIWNPNLPLIGHFPITNSMLVSWIVALGVIIFAQVATRNMKQVPEGAQNFWQTGWDLFPESARSVGAMRWPTASQLLALYCAAAMPI